MNIGVSINPLGASVSYVVPVSQLSYIELVVSARLDVSGLVRYITEVAVVQDAAAKTLSKPFADSIASPLDASIRQVQKVLADSVVMNDEAERFLVYIRDVNDAVTVPDTETRQVFPGPEVDGIGVADQRTAAVSKLISDAFSLNDSSEAGDGSTYSFAKYINNVVFSSDNLASVLTKPLADSFGTSDSGLVVAQGYCDITYFAEDYVGASSSF
jgi:hypothetical protein